MQSRGGGEVTHHASITCETCLWAGQAGRQGGRQAAELWAEELRQARRKKTIQRYNIERSLDGHMYTY